MERVIDEIDDDTWAGKRISWLNTSCWVFWELKGIKTNSFSNRFYLSCLRIESISRDGVCWLIDLRIEPTVIPIWEAIEFFSTCDTITWLSWSLKEQPKEELHTFKTISDDEDIDESGW